MAEQPTLDPSDPLPKAWPFEEAQKLAGRSGVQEKPAVMFETGYGPSGLPHIGTFGEVARTSWVRHAFETLTGLPTRLLAFSDDMDALRRVPDNVPQREMMLGHIGQPLTRIPDPFGTHESYGAHNNAELRRFLDRFGFDYEFASSTDYYRAGRFDDALKRVLQAHDEIIAVISPTVGPDRRATYSPILPIHPRTGQVMQVPIEQVDADAGTVVWRDPASGERFETSVTGGLAKCQWKADWAMRWYALGIDYEMSGKDLIDSVKLSSRICTILGAPPPLGFTYELFLDESGQKISKSKGNGLSVDEWLRYAPAESLSQFMYNQPHRAKRLHFDVIPRAVDELVANAGRLVGQSLAQAAANPAWHILGAGRDEPILSPVPFGMLLNLASVVNAETPEIVWGFLRRYAPASGPEQQPFLARLVEHAIVYYRDFVRPAKTYRLADEIERAALADLRATLDGLPDNLDAEAIQTLVYDVGNRHPFTALRDWCGCLYQVLLGQQEGPRFGGFIALYGIDETMQLIDRALSGGLAERAGAAG